MKQLFALLTGVALTINCSGDVPTSIDDLTPSFDVAGGSECYTVLGTISEAGEPPIFSGIITGDLQGTTVVELLGSFATGPVNHNELAFTYRITGGIVPDLIGEDLQLSASKLTTTYTPDDPDIGRINGLLRVESPGSGHLQLHGTVDVAGSPRAVLSLQYRGVVCP